MTQVKGKWYHLEKFSSMGNGFTFELETLIFSAAVSAVYEMKGLVCTFGVDASVYGDDIIVRTEAAADVIAALKYIGFTTNSDKTFLNGYFRESCGGDYFNGVPVRGYYMKESPNEPHQIIALCNGIYSASKEACGIPDPRFLRCWFKCLDLLPSHIKRLRGPEDLGDIVIHDDNEAHWQYRWRSGIRYLKVWRPAVYRKIYFDRYSHGVRFAAALYGLKLVKPDRYVEPSGFVRTLSDCGAFIVPRSGVTGYKTGRVPWS